MAKEILVVLPVKAEHKQRLEAAYPAGVFRYVPVAELTKEIAGQAHIIIGNLPPDLVGESTNLAWLQLNYAGIGKYKEPGVLPPQVHVTNASGAYGETIGEYLLAQLLSVQKKFHIYHDNRRCKLWQDEGQVKTIMGSKVLILGLGDIGCAFGRRIKALGGSVRGIRRHGSDRPDYIDSIHTMDELDALLPEADVVALVLPETPLTKGLMDRRRIALMKQGAILLNVGRGSAIDQAALAEALVSGHLWGAAIDVTTPDPLPQDDPLWTVPNLLLTPHVAGGFHLDDILDKVVELSATNLQRFFAGQPLLNLVDGQAGYRQDAGRWQAI